MDSAQSLDSASPSCVGAHLSWHDDCVSRGDLDATGGWRKETCLVAAISHVLVLLQTVTQFQQFVYDLAYSQPGSKFAGLLFYTDQTQNIAESCGNLIEPKMAEDWCDSFMQKHRPDPRPTDNKKNNTGL